MKIVDQSINDICQVDLDGRFDANTAGEVEAFFQTRINEGLTRFVLNLEKVPFVASAGLRVILVVAKQLRAKGGGDLHIAGLQESVLKVFEISGLNNVLKLFGTVDEAVSGF